MDLTFDLGKRDGVATKLHPVYDTRRNGYSLQLWENGQFTAEHGPFPYAGDVVETADDFLTEHGIRRLTGEERADLYTRLLRATGDLFYAQCVLMLAEPQDMAAMLMADEIARQTARLSKGEAGIVAFRIKDGSSDGRLYPDGEAAQAAQDDPDACAYVRLPSAPMGLRDGWTVDECSEHLEFLTHIAHGCMVYGRIPADCPHPSLPTPQL
ncbi:hypothetical protein P9869_35615 [Streptomyces ossamyceticus]|nr:hypothetical protein [Streptomyces ossamyceticus]